MGGFTSSRCGDIRIRRRCRPATSAVSKIATATADSRRGPFFSTVSRGRPAIVPYDGGVFIAVAPDIIYAKDTSGDGVADVKKVMFTRIWHRECPGTR